MRELQITVAGGICTGKTAIAQVIKEILEMYGVEVTVNDSEDDCLDNNIFRSYAALGHMGKTGLKIDISTHQTRQAAKKDPMRWY